MKNASMRNVGSWPHAPFMAAALATMGVMFVGTGDARAQEEQPVKTLVGGPNHFGGYVGLAPRYTQLEGRDGFLMNLEAAFLLDHTFAFGLAVGGGMAGDLANDDPNMALGYGALVFRYYTLCDVSYACMSIGAAVGFAGVDREHESKDAFSEKSPTGDELFYFEPQISGHLNVTRFFRLGVDLGYRMVAGANRYPRSDLQSVTAGMHAQVGWF